MALARAFSPLWGWAARRYQAALAKKLSVYGLRYDDLYDPLMDTDVDEALRRLPKDVVYARNARLRRALDLSVKKEKLPKRMSEQQTPYLWYLQDMLSEVKAEGRERLELGTGRPYQRTLP